MFVGTFRLQLIDKFSVGKRVRESDQQQFTQEIATADLALPVENPRASQRIN